MTTLGQLRTRVSAPPAGYRVTATAPFEDLSRIRHENLLESDEPPIQRPFPPTRIREVSGGRPAAASRGADPVVRTAQAEGAVLIGQLG